MSTSPSKRRDRQIIKKESSPIDIDMLSSGNRGSPIYIESDSTSDDEVDAQMDQGPAELDGHAGNAETQVDEDESDEEAEAEDVGEPNEITVKEDQEAEAEVKEERYSSPLEYEEPSEIHISRQLTRVSSHSAESEELVEHSRSPAAQNILSTSTRLSVTPARSSPAAEPVAVPSEQPAGAVPKPLSREPTKELSAEPPDSDQGGEGAYNQPAAARDNSPPHPSPDTSPADASRLAEPVVENPASSPSQSPSPVPDPITAMYIDLVRPKKFKPKPKMKMPPATQPPPNVTKRPVAFTEIAFPQAQSPRTAVKRKSFLQHFPASQPVTSITAPVRVSAGSSTAVSQRALTIDSGSDSEARQRKRTKVSGSPDAAFNAPFKAPVSQPKPFRRPAKHPDHWHTDGSVILSFKGTAFRLHRSRLSQQSTFFAELFHSGEEEIEGGKDELKVKARREGNMDGKPLFVVEGVSPDDFDKMLKAADNAIMFVFQPPSFAELASILRASLSLSFTSLSTFATHQLTAMWPRTLPSLHTPISGHRADAEETIVLARTCDLPALLKRAFYELLRAPTLGQSLDDEFMLAGDAAGWARRKVTRTDLVRLLRAREELAAQWARGAALPPDPRDFPCGGPADAPCALARAALVEHWRALVLGSDLYVEYMNDPVEGLERLAELPWAEKGFCEGCVGSWRASWMRQREKIWANLDLWLELPPEEGSGKGGEL